jgi:hypothetical protein
MKRPVLYLVFLLSVPAQEVSAAGFRDSTRSARWYLPHYVPLQFAGNIGLISTGIGYSSHRENYHLTLLYGYTPASVAQTQIHTITAKNTFALKQWSLAGNSVLMPYLGVGLSVEVGGIAFFTMPPDYPKGYYDFPKNLHVIGSGGLNLRHLFENDKVFLRGMEFYVEGGTVDVYIWYKTISDEIKWNQIFSLALGVNFLFRR